MRHQFLAHGRAAFPMFELDDPTGAAAIDPALAGPSAFAPAGSKRSTQNIGPQLIHHILQAAPTASASQLPDALLDPA